MKNYYLKQKVFSFRDSYKVYDADQKVVYHAKKKFMHPRTLSLYDANENRLLYILKRRAFTVRPGYRLMTPDKRKVAEIKKRFSMLGRKTIDIRTDQGDYMIRGNVWAHDFTVETATETLVVVRKKRLAWGDSYHIGIDDKADPALMVSLVVMLDNLYHSRSTKKSRGKRR